MLGKFAGVQVTRPMGFVDEASGIQYKLNYGLVKNTGQHEIGAFIMGVRHPVREFHGRVIAVIRCTGTRTCYYVLAPKGRKYIINDIRRNVSFAFKNSAFTLECLYEASCGAVVYRNTPKGREYLLIKNKRSEHWGFPKGHIEDGETEQQTARREVLEETGLHIDLLPMFSCRSSYTIQGRVEKQVTIFLATTRDTKTVIQESEIDDCAWMRMDAALKALKFENDRSILRRAGAFLNQRSARGRYQRRAGGEKTADRK